MSTVGLVDDRHLQIHSESKEFHKQTRVRCFDTETFKDNTKILNQYFADNKKRLRRIEIVYENQKQTVDEELGGQGYVLPVDTVMMKKQHSFLVEDCDVKVSFPYKPYLI